MATLKMLPDLLAASVNITRVAAVNIIYSWPVESLLRIAILILKGLVQWSAESQDSLRVAIVTIL